MYTKSRSVIRIGLLATMVLSMAAHAYSAVNWTSGAYWVSAPSVSGGGTLTIAGIPATPGPALTNLPAGFNYTNARLEYVFSTIDFDAVDRPILQHITWSIQRDFIGTPGWATNTSVIGGSAVIGPVPRVAGHAVGIKLTETTTHVNEGAASAATAVIPVFRLDAGTPSVVFSKTAATTFWDPGGADILRQDFDIEFSAVTTASIGSSVRFFFPGSADSFTAVPEPSALSMMGIGLGTLFLFVSRRPRRVRTALARRACGCNPK
jgi:hypothetical protein